MAAHLRFSPLSNPSITPRFLSHLPSTSLPFCSRPSSPTSLSLFTSFAGSDNPPIGPRDGGRGGGNGNGDGHLPDKPEPSNSSGLIGILLEGWRSRVSADPQFPFKVLMEELVGVSACVLGDMATRPNFGLNELDFVFSTVVVGSILNFVLMYLLAPTSLSTTTLPGLFSSCPPSHMFESGSFSFPSRFGTFVYKGLTFAAVGFIAGLAGTAISNGLIAFRKRMDPEFETPNKPPPTVLNAFTWALHMGLSSNLRYQTLNGIEFLMAKVLPPAGFKVSVVGLRCLNNVLGGASFVMLARLTGSQKVGEKREELKESLCAVVDNTDGELERRIDGSESK
ncbi:protein RETICULATA-RELATED 3, chloroplastic-like [Dioscorea cayenensis subsp. rotundata]|uniref:Protein RETICULATA-RELATED 3, chloroplastic-like n=1 Tax=Dioscorea cayennensis subsp. rotundata TaxID=55577 RepID=A0AB40D5Y9_DIOCR|nr:protein RETICULATA-RELATED 3, chloroplastic-like [Dioscorea cayenensis subsp. rotundata]